MAERIWLGQDRNVQIEDTFTFLLGRWRVDRSIDDHWGGVSGTFRGEATLEEAEGIFPGVGVRTGRYREKGELRLGGYSGEAGRELRYGAQPEGTVMVFFADGRPFVPLDLRASRWSAHHPCGEDGYRIAMEVVGPEVVRERWRVRGPTKDYDALTIITRLHG